MHKVLLECEGERGDVVKWAQMMKSLEWKAKLDFTLLTSQSQRTENNAARVLD